MEANEFKVEAQVTVVATQPAETLREFETLRELSALELSLVGGGSGSVCFV